MTPLKQFAASAIGSDLIQTYQNLRILLTIFIALILGVILYTSGQNIIGLTTTGYDRIDADNIARRFPRIREQPITRELVELQQIQREQNLEELSELVLRNYTIIFVIFIIGTWFGLYYILKPVSEASKARERFIAKASHELRTPLAILNSELSLIKDSSDATELRQVVAQSIEEVARMQDLSDTLLGRNITQKIVTVNTQELVLKLWQDVQILNHDDKSIEITGSNSIKIDESKFSQLILNILENFLKHASSKSVLQVELDKEKIIFRNPTNLDSIKPGIGIESAKHMAAEIDLDLNYQITECEFVVSIQQ